MLYVIIAVTKIRALLLSQPIHKMNCSISTILHAHRSHSCFILFYFLQFCPQLRRTVPREPTHQKKTVFHKVQIRTVEEKRGKTVHASQHDVAYK